LRPTNRLADVGLTRSWATRRGARCGMPTNTE
jgi:hypothetical protein